MQPDQQAGQRIEQPLAEVRDVHATSRQQDAVGEGVVDVAGDQQAVHVSFTLDDNTHDLGRRHPGVAELAQQAPLALGQVVGQLFDDVRRVAALDQAHDVPVQPNDLVQARDRPLAEWVGERPMDQRRVLARLGDLQPHVNALMPGPVLGAVRRGTLPVRHRA